MKRDKLTIRIIGGGVIGLSAGWRLARAGHDVSVYDANRAGSGASHVAGGMLAPVSEYGFDHDEFYALGTRSLSMYPSFLRDLEHDSGISVPMNTGGALMVALDRDDAESIRRLYRFREGRGLSVSWLTGTEAREMEPLLSPRVNAAMWIPDDHEIDNRKLIEALVEGLRRRGGRLYENTRVESIAASSGRAEGVVTSAGLQRTDVVVLAAGCHSGTIGGLPGDARLPVRPVKGQIVSLRRNGNCPLGRVIRTPDCYLVPKADGRLVVGATEEEMGFDTDPTAGPVMRLLERAWQAVPSIFDLSIESIDVGLRPGTRDHLPIIGPSSLDGLFVATGHYRHGILLAPVTADAVVESLQGTLADQWAAFAPSRFSTRENVVGTEG